VVAAGKRPQPSGVRGVEGGLTGGGAVLKNAPRHHRLFFSHPIRDAPRPCYHPSAMNPRRLLLLFCLFLLPLGAQTAETQTAAVRHVLDLQRDAWNRGDLAAFMQTYWHSPDLVFFGSKDEIRGWQAAMDRYRRVYGSDKAHMGHLEFTGLTVVPLGKDAATCWGHWRLTLPEGTKKEGLFTLILRHFPKGWRIIHDHSS